MSRNDDLLMLFTHHARVVVETSEVLDQIDLIGANDRTCIRFRALRKLHVEHMSDLIDMIEENADVLREQLKALLRVS
jgi:hypothetical protein